MSPIPFPFCYICYGPLTVTNWGMACKCCDRGRYPWEDPCPHRPKRVK